jgi:hypothetical protein
MTSPTARHLSAATLEEYVATGTKAAVPLEGAPRAMLVVDAPQELLSLEVSWNGEEPPAPSQYVHISTGVIYRDEAAWSTLTVHGKRFFAEAYPLLRSVADLVQIEGADFSSAVRTSLAAYHELLVSTAGMPIREEIGLVGELLVLSHLIDEVGPSDALAAWRGGDQTEEHDFGLAADDLEVKTTTSEARRHWIGSLGQLRPTPDRALWLMSIQVTAAGAGDGFRLPDLVAAAENKLLPGAAATFRDRIGRTNYAPTQPHDTYRLLRLRTAPACFEVSDDFPRLDDELLDRGGADRSRIEEVSYSILLDGLHKAANPPSAIATFCHEVKP